MKKNLTVLFLSTSFLFLNPLIVLADFAGTSNGASCTLSDGSSGMLYNNQCVSQNAYPSQSSPSGSSGGGINIRVVKSYSDSIVSVINGILVPVLFAIAFLYFVYGVYKYFILGAQSESEKGEGRQFVLWSIIGFAVIFSVWGLVWLVLNTFNIVGTRPPVPIL